MSAPKQPCGTHAAWRRHRNRNEEPCDPCKAARSAFNASRDTDSPRHPCPKCGKATRAHDNCLACTKVMESAEFELAYGDWVVRGGIQVWVPWPEDERHLALAAAPDDELTCRRRLAALVAEADGTPDPRRATA